MTINKEKVASDYQEILLSFRIKTRRATFSKSMPLFCLLYDLGGRGGGGGTPSDLQTSLRIYCQVVKLRRYWLTANCFYKFTIILCDFKNTMPFRSPKRLWYRRIDPKKGFAGEREKQEFVSRASPSPGSRECCYHFIDYFVWRNKCLPSGEWVGRRRVSACFIKLPMQFLWNQYVLTLAFENEKYYSKDFEW